MPTTTIANPYHYADNDPLNRVDPTGERSMDLDFDDPCFEMDGTPGAFVRVGACQYLDTGYHQRAGIPRLMTGAEVEYCFGSMMSQSSPWGAVGIPGADNNLAECAMGAQLAAWAKREALQRFSATGTCGGAYDVGCVEAWKRQYPARAGELATFDQPIDDSPGNAFQHAVWNALMTVEMGSDVAREIATRHEMAGGWEGPVAVWLLHSRQMDMANNWRLRAFMG